MAESENKSKYVAEDESDVKIVTKTEENENNENTTTNNDNNSSNKSSLKMLEWKNISVIIEKGKSCIPGGDPMPGTSNIQLKDGNKLQILHNINGSLSKGKLLGIMGGSGAGKSTLLNSLCGRLLSSNDKEISGEIVYNGYKRDIGKTDDIKNISAYVMQSDILPATETVHDALLFSARLRLPKNMPISEKENKVKHIIDRLKLNDCRNTFIGNDAIRGVSGGEKKRTSVGVELVTDPDLIFLDEPTSGLDSYTAQKTLDILKTLTSEEGKQVICTIHQPSSEIFSMLDELCLLAKGKCAYFGQRDKVIEYFANLGYQCPRYTNPADYIVNQIQINPQFFTDKWQEYLKNNNIEESNFDDLPILKPKPKSEASLCTQLSLLFRREVNILKRDKRPGAIRFAQTIIFAALVAILYFNLPDTQEGLRDRFGAVFFITINSSMAGLISTIIVFPEQRLLFEKERNSNMYTTTTYVIAKSLIQLPETCLFSCLYILVVYWSVGLNSTFGEVYIILTLCILSSGSMGMIVGCFANNTSEAMQIMPAAFIPLLLFANFMVSIDQIPIWIRWLQYLDVFKYVVEGFSITEFNDYNNIELNNNGQGYSNGDSYLDFLGYDTDNLYFTWYMTAVLFIGFRIITWIILVRRNGW